MTERGAALDMARGYRIRVSESWKMQVPMSDYVSISGQVSIIILRPVRVTYLFVIYSSNTLL